MYESYFKNGVLGFRNNDLPIDDHPLGGCIIGFNGWVLVPIEEVLHWGIEDDEIYDVLMARLRDAQGDDPSIADKPEHVQRRDEKFLFYQSWGDE